MIQNQQESRLISDPKLDPNKTVQRHQSAMTITGHPHRKFNLTEN